MCGPKLMVRNPNPYSAFIFKFSTLTVQENNQFSRHLLVPYTVHASETRPLQFNFQTTKTQPLGAAHTVGHFFIIKRYFELSHVTSCIKSYYLFVRHDKVSKVQCLLQGTMQIFSHKIEGVCNSVSVFSMVGKYIIVYL